MTREKGLGWAKHEIDTCGAELPPLLADAPRGVQNLGDLHELCPGSDGEPDPDTPQRAGSGRCPVCGTWQYLREDNARLGPHDTEGNPAW